MRKLTSEFLGTFLLALAIVGAGAMATSITHDGGLRLFINATVAGSVLILIINSFGSISGGHFNPAVTLAVFVKKEITPVKAAQYILAQILGGITGVITANFLFEETLVATRTTSSPSVVAIVSEVFSTAGLLFVIRHLLNEEKDRFLPIGVGTFIFAGYFFTPTSVIANPAMTIGRAFTDTYAGIASSSVLAFVFAQLVGGLLGSELAQSLKKKKKK